MNTTILTFYNNVLLSIEEVIENDLKAEVLRFMKRTEHPFEYLPNLLRAYHLNYLIESDTYEEIDSRRFILISTRYNINNVKHLLSRYKKNEYLDNFILALVPTIRENKLNELLNPDI